MRSSNSDLEIKTMKNAFWVLAVLTCVIAVHAQTWTNRYDGIAHGSEYVVAIATDKSGNVFVAGTSEGADSFVPDFVLIKYSNAGAPLWVNRYTLYNREITSPAKISVDSQGNVLVVSTPIWGQGSIPMRMLMKVSGSGAKLWTNSTIGEVVLGPNGELAAITETNLVMYSASGSAIHTNTFYDYAGTFNDFTLSPVMSFDTQSNLLTTVFDAFGYTTVKYSSSSERMWVRKYSSSNVDEYAFPAAIVADQAGNVIVTGRVTVDPTQPGGKSATVKYSENGMPVWTNRNNYLGEGLAIDNEGNVNVGGLHGAAKYSASGLLLWTNPQPITVNGSSYRDEIKVDTGNSFIISSVTSTGTGESEVFLQKYSSSGMLMWTHRYALAGRSYTKAGVASVVTDASENVFLGMTSEVASNDSDFVTMKIVPPSALNVRQLPSAVVLSWGNPGFSLQAAASPSGTFTNIPVATSPYTTTVSNPHLYFRLRQQPSPQQNAAACPDSSLFVDTAPSTQPLDRPPFPNLGGGLSQQPIHFPPGLLQLIKDCVPDKLGTIA